MFLGVPAIANLGTPELVIIVLVVLLLFGGKKLPEIARGSGRALRIFKAETKGLVNDDDEDSDDTPSQRPTSTSRAQLPSGGSGGQTPPSGAQSAQGGSSTYPADESERSQPLPPTHTEP